MEEKKSDGKFSQHLHKPALARADNNIENSRQEISTEDLRLKAKHAS